MKRYAFILLLLFSQSLYGQFQLSFAGGKINSILRVEDTLYLWGEDMIFRSLDWGETLEKWEPLQTYADRQRWSSGYNSSLSIYDVIHTSHTVHESFVRQSQSPSYPYLNFTYRTYTPNRRARQTISALGSVFARLLPDGAVHTYRQLSTEYSHTFSYYDEAGQNQNKTWVSTLFSSGADGYCKGHFLSIKPDSILIFRAVDESVIRIPFFRQPYFFYSFGTHSDSSLIFYDNRVDSVFLFRVPDNVLTKTPLPVTGADKIWQHRHELLLKKGNIYLNVDLNSGQLDTLNVSNVPAFHRIFYTGKKYIALQNDSSNTLYQTTNLGLRYTVHPQVPATRFHYVFDHQDTIFALHRNTLYSVPANAPTQMMTLRNQVNLPGNPYTLNDASFETLGANSSFYNLGKYLILRDSFSMDYGVSWSHLQTLSDIQSAFKWVFTDFKWNRVYFEGKDASGTLFLYAYDFDKLNLVKISLPTGASIPGLSSTMAKGDTLIYKGYLSINTGVQWTPIVLNPPFSFPTAWAELVSIDSNGFWLVLAGYSSFGPNFHGSSKYDFNGTLLETKPLPSGISAYFSHLKNAAWVVTTGVHTGSGFYQYVKADHYGGTRKPLGFDRTTLYEKQYLNFGITDNYYYHRDTLYPLSGHFATLETCDSALYQGQHYTPGWHVLTGNIYQPDTILRVHQLPFSYYYTNINLCYLDTFSIHGKFAIADGTLPVLIDTVYGVGQTCGEITQYRIYASHLQKIMPDSFFCGGDTLMFHGQPVWKEAVLYDTIPGIRPACDTIRKFTFRPQYHQRQMPVQYVCQGDTVWHNGQPIFNTITVRDTVSGQGASCDTIVRYTYQARPPTCRDTASIHCLGQSVEIFDSLLTQTTTLKKWLGDDRYGCDSLLCHTAIFYPAFSNEHRAPIRFCEGDSIFFLGKYYSTSTTVDTVYASGLGANPCRRVLQPILMEMPNYIPLSTTYFCPSIGIEINGDRYFSDTSVLVHLGSCDFGVMPLEALPTTTLITDTIGLAPFQVQGQFYWQDTTLVNRTAYLNFPCDSSVHIIHITIQTSTTKNIAKSHAMKVVPNPTSSTTTITWQQGRATATLFSVLGQSILKDSGEKQLVIDLSQLENGVYFAKVEWEDGYIRVVRIVRSN